nr:uncharacterized protein LOC127333463 isoform X2 [Lolium perenne]
MHVLRDLLVVGELGSAAVEVTGPTSLSPLKLRSVTGQIFPVSAPTSGHTGRRTPRRKRFCSSYSRRIGGRWARPTSAEPWCGRPSSMPKLRLPTSFLPWVSRWFTSGRAHRV